MLSDWSDVHDSWTQPGSAGENLRFHHFPAFHLMTLASLAKASISRFCLEPAGLSMPEWRLLTAVIGDELVPFAQVAAMTMMDKGQISRTLRTAQSKGLIETEVKPLEKRAQDASVSSIGRVMVRITQTGREVYEKVMPSAQQSQLRLIELMTQEERQLVVELARRFYEQLAVDLRERRT